MIKNIVIGCLLAFMPLQLKALVSYRLLVNNEGKKVLLYGDAHRTDLDTINETHMMFLLQTILVTDINEVNTCFYELNEQSTQSNDRVAKTFEMIHQFKDALVNKIALIPYDMRDRVSTILATNNDWYDELSSAAGINNLQANPRPHLVNTYAGLETRGRREAFISYQQLHDYLTTCLDSVQALSSTFAKNSQEARIFAVLYTLYQKMRQNFLDFIKDMKLHDYYELFVLRRFLQNPELKNIHDYRELQMQLIKAVEDFDLLYADIHFLHKALKHLEQHSRVSMILGSAHVQRIGDFLEKLGYKTIAQHDCMIEYHPLYSKLEHSPEFIHDIVEIYKLYVAQECPTIEQIQESLKSTPGTEKLLCCPVCFALKEKLDKCGGCKQKAYCSSGCQKLDWKWHRETCKKNAQSSSSNA